MSKPGVKPLGTILLGVGAEGSLDSLPDAMCAVFAQLARREAPAVPYVLALAMTASPEVLHQRPELIRQSAKATMPSDTITPVLHLVIGHHVHPAHVHAALQSLLEKAAALGIEFEFVPTTGPGMGPSTGQVS